MGKTEPPLPMKVPLAASGVATAMITALLMREIGKVTMEAVYGVSIDDVNEHQEELNQQGQADYFGWGINSKDSRCKD